MKLINQLINYFIIGLVFLLPLFFLPVTTEFYTFNKQTLLFVLTGILTLLWLVKLVISQKLTFRKTSFDLPVILFLAAFVIVSLVSAPNKTTAFTEPLGAGTIFALTLLYFIITNNFKAAKIQSVLYAFIISSVILGLVAVYQYLGLGEALTNLPWLENKLFTPAGGPLILISILMTALALAVTSFFKQFGKNGLLTIIFTGGASIIIAVGLILTIYQFLPGQGNNLALLSYPESWSIGIETFKQNPLFGVGPGNYTSAFNRFRSITFNDNQLWDVRFGNASNYPLELLTIGGLLVIGAYFFLLIKTIRLFLKAYQKKETYLPLLFGLILVIFIPWFLGNNLVLLSLNLIFLALLTNVNEEVQTVSTSSKNLSLITLGIGLVLIVTLGYFWGRVYAADVAFRNSLNALTENRGTVVYNQQIRAINLNPYNPNYRRSYSQTNFALANSIASQQELTDQDRANITQLIQQAIREAKTATVLNPTDAANWENLAQIYRNLINFAQGADQWAIAAYQQAVITDPINPRIRLNLGGLFYSLQNFESATRQFQNAVELKPDYANGYYNLAAAYRERKMYQEAYLAMQNVLNLIPLDSDDYQRAKSELDELAQKLPTPEEVTPTEEEAETPVLTEPSPLPSPKIQPPIELPEEAAPEIPEEEPEEKVSPTPKVSPSP